MLSEISPGSLVPVHSAGVVVVVVTVVVVVVVLVPVAVEDAAVEVAVDEAAAAVVVADEDAVVVCAIPVQNEHRFSPQPRKVTATLDFLSNERASFMIFSILFFVFHGLNH